MRSDLERRKLGGTLILNNIRLITKCEKDKLIELSRSADSMFQREREDRIKCMEQKIAEAKDHEARQRIVDDDAPDIVDYRDYFPAIQRYLLLVMVMSWVETKLISLCRITDYIFEEGDPFKSRDPGVLKRAIEHLEKKAKIDTSCIEFGWTLAKYLQEIRNCIIHNEGFIDDAKIPGAIYCIINSVSGIDKYEEFKGAGNKLVLELGFVEESANNMHIFLEQLIDLIINKVVLEKTGQ